MNKFTFSIIIPTFNRKKYLIDTLEYIKRLSVQPIEVIVVDVSNIEFQLSKEDCWAYPLLNYFVWPEYGNISKQRNFGISIAKGEYILFLDDDVTFESNLIENYIIAFNETNADGISGLIETSKYSKGSNPIRYKEVLLNSFEENVQACNFITTTKLICTASFAIKTNVLRSVNGFDELQRGTFDDIELGFRLFENKYKILHHPLPIVFHIQAPASGARDLKQGNQWGVENQVYFMLKHIYRRNKKVLLIKMILEVLKPSRAWLNPSRNYKKLKDRIKAFNRANNCMNV